MRVIAEGDEQGRGGVRPDAVDLSQGWAGVRGQGVDLGVQCFGFGVQVQAALGQ